MGIDSYDKSICIKLWQTLLVYFFWVKGQVKKNFLKDVERRISLRSPEYPIAPDDRGIQIYFLPSINIIML